MTAFALAKEVGVSQQTLSRWRTAAHSLPCMNPSKQDDGSGTPKSLREWTAAEKLEVVLDAARLSEAELGAFLRERGLHLTQLESWRALIASALAERRPQKAGSHEEQLEVPLADWKEPKPHGKQELLPVMLANEPGSQFAQLVWPLADWKVPTSHDVHTL